MFGRKPREEDPVSTLARCITLLDDTRAYRRKDPERIDEAFAVLKKTRFKEHYDMWVKLRPAAEKIADMPMKVPGVPKTIRALAWLKVINRVGLILLIFFLAIQIVPAWRRVLGPDVFGGNALLYSAIAVIAVVLLMNLGTFLDYHIRRKIIAYEDSTMDLYAPARDKMKEGVNRMMKSLAKEANRSGNRPQDFDMVLYFDDYDHVQVVKQWKPKALGLFKKRYNYYQVTPKL